MNVWTGLKTLGRMSPFKPAKRDIIVDLWSSSRDHKLLVPKLQVCSLPCSIVLWYMYLKPSN